MFSWLLSKHIKKEIKDHLQNLHLHLTHSFSNIKNDISNIHIHLQNKDKKLIELEGKIHLLETRLIYAFHLKETSKQIAEPEIDYEESKEVGTKEEVSSIAGITYTQQTIIVAICELQSQLNSPISFKSLAQYHYPGKKYQAVRTTLSEYIDLLAVYGFVKKERIGRETAALVTKKGEKLAKEIIKKEKMKKKLKIEER